MELGQQTVTPWMELGNGKYKREHTLQKTSEPCSTKAQELASPSLKKQTRKALLHKPMFVKLGKDLPTVLGQPTWVVVEP